MSRALIARLTGHDGAYLAERLLEKGYSESGQCTVVVELHYFHPTEVETWLEDASKGNAKLSWVPSARLIESGEQNDGG